MTSESERWKTGDLRNTVGSTRGATGPVTGGVAGHVKSQPVEREEETAGEREPVDRSFFTGGG